MKQLLLPVLLFISITCFSQPLLTRFERSSGTETVTYPEGMAYWKTLVKKFPQMKMLTMGMTDSGYPLNLVVYSSDRDFSFSSLRQKGKCLILINNAIHPGEPDGVDASMMLLRDLALGKIRMPENVALAVIPFYNIGGVLNRTGLSRPNQNGPREYGFRGNAENLDLNRDFIKSDSKNAEAFAEIYHLVNPDIFIDNHVSDGADYQHIMTLIVTQHDKLDGEEGEYLHNMMVPGIYALMKQKGYDLVPYVNDFQETPDSGWTEFYDSPRYSTGYAALFGSFGFMPETHMLKPYKQRVESDYALMRSFIEFAGRHAMEILRIRAAAASAVKTQREFALNWKPDMSRYALIDFKGYEAGHKPSEISGLPRLYYDRSRPYEKQVKFYDHFIATDSARKPDAYIIPRGWWNVIRLLKLNGVKMRELRRDTMLEVEAYHIDAYQASPRAYEKHHLNSEVKVSAHFEKISFLKGDYYIPMNQEANRYLVETLEPTGGDSFFAWNFFDAILGEKEGYSAYVFEDTAAKYLRQHPALRDSLEKKRLEDPAFSKSAAAQLNYIYRHSPWFEPEYMRYPVYRFFK